MRGRTHGAPLSGVFRPQSVVRHTGANRRQSRISSEVCSARHIGLTQSGSSVVVLLNLARLPFTLLDRGLPAAACMFFFLYAIILVCAAKAMFDFANYAGVRIQTGTASVVAKRIVPEHWEWIGRTPVRVKEYETLDLQIGGRLTTYRPVPWILERTTANTTELVQFKAGRLNGKVQVEKFKYL